MVKPDFSEVIETIYNVPQQPESLYTALDAVERYIGAGQVHLLVCSLEGTRAFAADALTADRFSTFWSTRDIGQQLGSTPEREVVDVSRSIGYGSLPWAGAFAAVVAVPPGSDMSVLIVPLQNNDSGDRAIVRGKLQQVLPHLSRATFLWRRLDANMPTVKVTTQLVRDLPLPTLLTDCDGRCIEANGAFTALKSSLAVKIVSGRLTFRDDYLQDSWQSALRETTGTAVGRSLLADSGTGRQWRVHLQPIPCVASARSFEPEHFVLAVFEEHAPVPYADPERIATVSKLTKAELNVLTGLLQGFTGKVIARSRNASVNTVRSQIMSILTKTGHHSQKELIASFNASSFDANSVLNSSNHSRMDA